jgi:hypothetical protein
MGKSPGALEEAATPAPFEGETTINSQSDYAREFLAKAVGSTPSIEQNEEVKSALFALNELVTRQGHATTSTVTNSHVLINRSLAEIDPEALERPPWEVSNEVLDKGMSKLTL